MNEINLPTAAAQTAAQTAIDNVQSTISTVQEKVTDVQTAVDTIAGNFPLELGSGGFNPLEYEPFVYVGNLGSPVANATFTICYSSATTEGYVSKIAISSPASASVNAHMRITIDGEVVYLGNNLISTSYMLGVVGVHHVTNPTVPGTYVNGYLTKFYNNAFHGYEKSSESTAKSLVLESPLKFKTLEVEVWHTSSTPSSINYEITGGVR